MQIIENRIEERFYKETHNDGGESLTEIYLTNIANLSI